VVEVVECLPSKDEAPSSNPSTIKNKTKPKQNKISELADGSSKAHAENYFYEKHPISPKLSRIHSH
jgi:hypothetical protein